MIQSHCHTQMFEGRWVFLKIHFFFMLCVWVLCFCVGKWIVYMPGTWRGQNMVGDPLDLGLQMILRCHVGGGNWTWVHCSYASAATALNHWAIAPVPRHEVLIQTYTWLRLTDLSTSPHYFWSYPQVLQIRKKYKVGASIWKRDINHSVREVLT